MLIVWTFHHMEKPTRGKDFFLRFYQVFFSILILSCSEPSEYAPVEETFSPILHRINQVVKHRAIYPFDPLPPPHAILTKYAHPPKSVLDGSKPHLENLINACNIKRGINSTCLY
jgi:hypothetical protein